MLKKSRRILFLASLASCLVLFGTAFAAAANYDVIIRHGMLVDGSGQPGVRGDIAIEGDRIAAIGDLSSAEATQEVDAKGLVVAPGFVNMLSWAVDSLVDDGRGLSDITQGVTLEVFGEGWSMGPLADTPATRAMMKEFLDDDTAEIPWTTLGEYLEFLENRGVSPNVASFVGATTLRIHEIGFDDRPPTPAELDNMRALTREAMEEGAMGLGSSLIYPPAFFASTDELIELAKVVGEYGGMYISHMRSEGNQIEKSVQELITIAREGKVGAEIYHLKMAGKQNWGKLPAVVKMIESARAEGLNITTDMYTYIAGGTGLAASFPPWASDGGQEALLNRLKDPETRAQIIAAMRTNADDWENLYYGAGPDGVLLSSIGTESMSGYIGKTVAEIAKERGTDPEDTVVELVIDSDNSIGALYFLMNEDNVRAQMKLPWMSFGSDAGAVAPEGKVLEQGAHPRTYGNFARVLGRYVRDEKVLTLEDAIYKLSALPTSNLKVRDRGLLKTGYFADIVVFDPETISDHATFEKPHQLSTGMVHVFINGDQVLKDGKHTGATPGRFVRGPGYRPAGVSLQKR
ncbi:MAG TPA: D-aminoacylase [Woeseiaceae bacterium]|nr:D-aminoacylase [Woeseiaceae bacterium]